MTSTATIDVAPKRGQGKAAVPPYARHCARCEILIFDSPEEVPSYLSPALHQAHGEHCPECDLLMSRS